MRYEIILAAEAVEDLHRLKAHERSRVRAALEQHLRHEPTKTSKSRIKRLQGLVRPQFRLRIGNFRVFYDIAGDVVEVLAIVSKADAGPWLEQRGNPGEEGTAFGSEE